jgi:hypothetical protein
MGYQSQSQIPGRTTLLEAVNTVLAAIGEAPVQKLENQTLGEAFVAQQAILEVHKEGQTRGWGWNTDRQYEFLVNEDDELWLPANVVRWVPDRYMWGNRLQQRGQRIWDGELHTFKLGPAIPSVEADVVWLLSWDECPEQFNRWATTRAGRVMGARVLGNDSLVGFTLKDEQDAMAELQRMETENENYNMLTSGQLYRPVPTFSPARGLLRRGIGGIPIG